jgi:hypothetical protein
MLLLKDKPFLHLINLPTLDNGLNIQVPPFIDSGDEVIVDTRTLEYIKKI